MKESEARICITASRFMRVNVHGRTDKPVYIPNTLQIHVYMEREELTVTSC